MCSHLKRSRYDANPRVSDSEYTKDPSRPSVPFAGMAKKPCTATNSIVPHCARPPIPAWLGALIGYTAGCQTTDRLLPTIFGYVLSFHMTVSEKTNIDCNIMPMFGNQLHSVLSGQDINGKLM